MSAPAAARPRKRHWLFDMVPLALCFALLFAVSFLPPDNARYEVDRLGRLSVCMPTLYPPLVTDDADMPGFEVELMEAWPAGRRNGLSSGSITEMRERLTAIGFRCPGVNV